MAISLLLLSATLVNFLSSKTVDMSTGEDLFSLILIPLFLVFIFLEMKRLRND